jgi:surface polysaccharide O-acyltransferase-like enzyme
MKTISRFEDAYSADKLQSLTIDLLRFPLAIMVIFIHMGVMTVAPCNADFPMLSGRGIFNLIAILLSHSMSTIAVPTFFLISGFLFFIKSQELTFDVYRYKIKRRLHSLIIPYFLWNALAVVILVLFYPIIIRLHNGTFESITEVLSKGWHIFYDYNSFTPRRNWLGYSIHGSAPYVVPLWFLRDLIVVTILSPLIYFCVRKLKICWILLLFVAYISKIWIPIQGMGVIAFFYFSLGAYLAINRHNIVTLVHKYRYIIVSGAAVLLALECYYDGSNTEIGYELMPYYSVFGVFAAFYIASRLIVKFSILPNKLLVSSCFFVYAMHNIVAVVNPLGVSKAFLKLIFSGQSVINEAICYVAAPFLAAAICVAIYALCRRFLPKITLVFSGNK